MERDGADTAARILKAATGLLAAEGMEALSMRRIAAIVGISQAAIYRHFEDKAALVGRIVGEGYERLVALMEGIAAGPGPAPAILAASIAAYVDFALGSRDLFKAVLLRDAGPARDRVAVLGPGATAGRRSFELLESLLARGMAEGHFAPADPPLTAQALWTAMFGLAARAVLEPALSEDRLAALVRRQSDIIIGGLRPGGGERLPTKESG